MTRLDHTYLKQVHHLLKAANLMTEDIDLNKHQLYGKFVNNNLIAIAALEVYDNQALLRSVAVDQKHKNEGYGKSIVLAVEAEALKNGILQVYLLTETAAKFFSKLGYIQIDRMSVPNKILNTTQFAELCPQSAVCMTKKLINE